MRFRLLRRRLTISAPRMSVRSALPWPFRWAVFAIVLGFCAAIGLWAFEFGKDIAGLEKGSKEELTRLRNEVVSLHQELDKAKELRDQAQSVANTAGTLVTAEKAAQQQLVAQAQQLEADNRRLRDDLGFFEKLIPASGGDGVSIRGVQAELVGASTVKWQVLVIQASKNAPEFVGRLELSFSGTLNGRPWVGALPEGSRAVAVRQYGRFDGEFELPPQVVLKLVSAKVSDAAGVKSTQSIKL
ncbi:MAG: hypothetical protein CFE43_11785 [Burkholderiales bacterium PBB3]|nr:MAG: hypothetical protein CFE43_11785 [Burkholderiales bacterium PBB3]